MEGVDFPDALKILAERTGVSLKEYRPSSPKMTITEKDEMLQLYEKVTQFYEHQLWATPAGAKVREYLSRRGVTDETAKIFRLGFSPDSYEATYTYLLQHGFSRKLLVSAGISLTQETIVEKIYDRFRGRLMFPISDGFGRVIAFGGRALKSDQEPKYLNSPETPLYHKSSVLYGYSHAKPFIKEKQKILIVEGYMDLIAAFQAGVKNIVAVSGTALTEKHLRILKPFVSELTFAFDMDNAGQEACRRAFELAQPIDLAIHVALLPEGKDIAEFCLHKASELDSVIQSAKSYGDYFYEKLLKTYGGKDISSQKKIVQEFVPFLLTFKSSLEKDTYVRHLALELGIQESFIYDEMKRPSLPSYHPARQQRTLENNDKKNRKFEVDQMLIGFMLEFPRLSKIMIGEIHEQLFSDQFKPIYKSFIDYYNNTGLEGVLNVIPLLPVELQEEAALIALYIRELHGEISEENAYEEMKKLLKTLKKEFLQKKVNHLQRQILQAEKIRDKAALSALLVEKDKFHTELLQF